VNQVRQHLKTEYHSLSVFFEKFVHEHSIPVLKKASADYLESLAA